VGLGPPGLDVENHVEGPVAPLDAEGALLGEGFGQGSDQGGGILELVELDEDMLKPFLHGLLALSGHADHMEGQAAGLRAGVDAGLLEEEVEGPLHHGIPGDEGLDLLVGEHPAGLAREGGEAVPRRNLDPGRHAGPGAAGRGEGEAGQGHRGGDQDGGGASHGGS